MGIDGEFIPEKILLEVSPELATILVENRGCAVDGCIQSQPWVPLTDSGELLSSRCSGKWEIRSQTVACGISVAMANGEIVVRPDGGEHICPKARRCG